jgi:hypothetical protein
MSAKVGTAQKRDGAAPISLQESLKSKGNTYEP